MYGEKGEKNKSAGWRSQKGMCENLYRVLAHPPVQKASNSTEVIMPGNKKEAAKRQYEHKVSFQEDNHEARGGAENQNDHHNVKRQALGPNGERNKR